MRNPERERLPETAGSNPAPGTPSNAYYETSVSKKSALHLPLPLDLGSYYNFLSTAMIILFIIGLVIVFVYEYEALRRTKT